MSDTPPPLPLAQAVPLRSLPGEIARLGPPHAPLLWRTLAFVVDTSLFGLLGYLIVSRFLLPEYKPEELSAFNSWRDGIFAQYGDLIAAAQSGNEAAVNTINQSILTAIKEMPSAVYEISSYTSSAMTLIYWIGFSLSEILTGGASLGKRIFRLRVATFPYAEKPGIFDSLVRNGWKAMAVASLNPLALLFALVDAHWPLFNPYRRSLHDLLSRTIVFDARFDKPEPAKPAEDDEDDA